MSVCSDAYSVVNCIEQNKPFNLSNNVTELNLTGMFNDLRNCIGYLSPNKVKALVTMVPNYFLRPFVRLPILRSLALQVIANNSNPETLDNRIRDAGAGFLAEGLKANKGLTSLDLSGIQRLKILLTSDNYIGNGGVQLITEALMNNTSLTYLSLDCVFFALFFSTSRQQYWQHWTGTPRETAKEESHLDYPQAKLYVSLPSSLTTKWFSLIAIWLNSLKMN